MSITQLDSENADRDLTSQVAILTNTPSATVNMVCQGYVEFGDGTKNLDGTGGSFQFTITVGGQTVEPDPQRVQFSTAVRAAAWTGQFVVPANKEVVWKILSPNGGDTDVDVTAYLFDVSPITVDETVEGTLTQAQVLRLILSRFAGLASGGGTTAPTFRDLADTKNRIVMTVDTNGNRTAIPTLDGT
ncbi:MAG TPA: hypothetical protein ENI27_05920 [bacterium]|nr:hypothetical protein [bacterium]